MKIRWNAIAAMLLLGLAQTTWAAEWPVVFGRSGRQATISIGGQWGDEDGLVVLTANGQRWGEPAIVKNGGAEFVAPAVRAPMVFRLASLKDAARVVPGELIVYPDGWLPWETDKELLKYKKTQFAAVGIPDWLDTWFGAVGFPIEKLSGPDAREGQLADAGETGVADFGTKRRGPRAGRGRTAGDRPPGERVGDRGRLAGQIDDAGCGDRDGAEARRGPLDDLRTQDWAIPPTFGRQTVPWPVLWNRLTWLDGAEYPLVEEVYSRQKGGELLRIVFNYLPWQEQLGRCEMADELLLRIMTETAKGAEDRARLDGRWCLLYPSIKEIKTETRPVLFAANRSAATKVDIEGATVADTELPEIRGYVLDLRGGSAPPEELFEDTGIVKKIESRIDKHTPLLILGDSRQLDAWEWLELDREHQKSPRPGVCWLPDRTLPASLEWQLRVMDVFTQWNVFLGDTSREKTNENRENEL